MRQLASIRRVRQITPIEGADFIVKAQVDGWQCVVKKGEFNVGDFGVYFEIDSFLPASDARYNFLEKNYITWEEKLGARSRTQKFKGQIAQGLLLPLSLFPEISDPQEGVDYTELLGILKWEAAIPAELSGEVEGAIPSFIRKTDEERIQNLIDQIPTEISGQTFEGTIKLDGTSMTVFFHEERTGVCGRNWEYRENNTNTLWRVARRNKLIDVLSILSKNVALQGELIGENIQENNEKIKGQQFYLFNVWDIDKQAYMPVDERYAFVEQMKAHGAQVEIVPTLGEVTFSETISVEEILATADGPSLFAANREGVVYKRKDGQYSFKAISNWYLAKHANR
jgi:RNA ligase (TIGR02306 family)